ncbi:DUF2608 domain-containing protein [Vibrio chagasii]|nr:DUF2608 domain-containing protein [Vibrio chagasii]
MCWSVFASGADRKDVLVIHSLPSRIFWTDDFHKGLSEELDRDGLSFSRVVYLDNKRSQNPEYLTRVPKLTTPLMLEFGGYGDDI